MSNKVVIVCGAGISASAGIPTYYSHDAMKGLWDLNKMSEVCTVGHEFNKVSLEFYDEFRKKLSKIPPSEVHHKFAELQKKYGKDRFQVFTQNIDDLLERAGCTANHIHGEVTYSRCDDCNNTTYIAYEPLYANNMNECNHCGGKLKNNVVFYGDKGHYQEMLETILDMDDEDIFILIGTSCRTIHVDTMIRCFDYTKIYMNPIIEKSVDLSQYTHVLQDKIELCLDQLEYLINEYMK